MSKGKKVANGTEGRMSFMATIRDDDTDVLISDEEAEKCLAGLLAMSGDLFGPSPRWVNGDHTHKASGGRPQIKVGKSGKYFHFDDRVVFHDRSIDKKYPPGSLETKEWRDIQHKESNAGEKVRFTFSTLEGAVLCREVFWRTGCGAWNDTIIDNTRHNLVAMIEKGMG